MQRVKYLFGLLLLFSMTYSCRRPSDVSIRMMNAKCKFIIGTSIRSDSIEADRLLIPVDEENLAKLLPEIEDETQWKVFFYGKRKMGKLRAYSLLLSNGENRVLRLVIIKGKTPISDFEVAGNNQLEGYSYTLSSQIIDDSTVVTRKYQFLQTDEPETPNSNDSIISVYRINPNGTSLIVKSDTMAVVPQIAMPDDGEYSDEVFYYNGNSPKSWIVAGINDSRRFKDFYMQFRNMVKLNDKDQIANYINYPLGIIKDESDFVKNYDKIITNTVRNAILGQKIRQLYRDKRGVMIGDDQLWFKQINGAYKIVVIKQ